MENALFKNCPFCKEKIRNEAVKCRFCGEWLEEPHSHGATVPNVKVASSVQPGSFATPNPKIISSDIDSKTQVREISRNQKLLILAGASLCAVLFLHFTNILPLIRPPRVAMLTYLAWAAGHVLAIFIFGAPFAAWIKGRKGLVIGLIVIIIACALQILGNSVAPTNGKAEKTYRITDPKTGIILEVKGDSQPTESDREKIFSEYYQFNKTKAKAEQGDAKAQYDLGNCYDTGKGVAKNVVEAVRWFRKSAEQNYAPSQCNLWISYHIGSGVPADEAEAMKWLRKAVEQDDADAESFLGFCYKVGQGVATDYAEAVKWYRKAAEQDLSGTEAVYELGNCYYYGQGVSKDYVEAHKWFTLASAHGNIDAKRALPTLEALMTSEQIVEGKRLAREFKPRNK